MVRVKSLAPKTIYKTPCLFSKLYYVYLDKLAERARRPLLRPYWKSPLPTTSFNLKMISMDSLTPKT